MVCGGCQYARLSRADAYDLKAVEDTAERESLVAEQALERTIDEIEQERRRGD